MYIHNDYLFIMFILLLRVSFFPTILVPFNASCFNDKNNPNMKLQVAQVCTSPTFQFPQPNCQNRPLQAERLLHSDNL